MFPSKFLQFPSILTHFHAANEKIQNGGRDLAISRGLVWVNYVTGLWLLPQPMATTDAFQIWKRLQGRNPTLKRMSHNKIYVRGEDNMNNLSNEMKNM